jgi:hypothetical protein
MTAENPTYRDIASSWALWLELSGSTAIESKMAFDALTVEQKIAIQVSEMREAIANYKGDSDVEP